MTRYPRRTVGRGRNLDQELRAITYRPKLLIEALLVAALAAARFSSGSDWRVGAVRGLSPAFAALFASLGKGAGERR
jgi:hypothetical protein